MLWIKYSRYPSRSLKSPSPSSGLAGHTSGAELILHGSQSLLSSRLPRHGTLVSQRLLQRGSGRCSLPTWLGQTTHRSIPPLTHPTGCSKPGPGWPGSPTGIASLLSSPETQGIGICEIPQHEDSQNPSQPPWHPSGSFKRRWTTYKHNPLERVLVLYPWECLTGRKTSQCKQLGRTIKPQAKSLLGLNNCPSTEHPMPRVGTSPPQPYLCHGALVRSRELRGSRRASGKCSLGAGGFKGAPAPTPGRAVPGGMCPAPMEECNTCELLFRQPRPWPPPPLPLPPRSPYKPKLLCGLRDLLF